MKLLERDLQLGMLNSALAEVRAGTGRMALLSGEAGIGKTALVEEFTRAQHSSLRVLRGSCESLYTPRPLGPIHDISLQAGGRLLESFELETNPTNVFSNALAALQEGTTILVIEDIQWADEATLDLLRFLCRRIAQTLTLLLLVYRDDELSPQHPLRTLLGDLATAPNVLRMTLPPFSEQAVRQLVGGRDIDAADLHRRTGGNPFFVTEVLASPHASIPGTVRDAVLARTARLSASGWAVLEAAAVTGQRAEAWLLAEMAGAEVGAMEECIACGILLAQGELLAFRHQLAWQTILETISPLRSQILHRMALDSLRAAPATRQDLARLAHHAEATGDQEAVLEYAPTAARQAGAAGAHREAATLYELALRFPDRLQLAEHAALLEDYSRECNLTERQSEGIAARRQALAIYQELGDVLKQGEILAASAVMLRNSGRNAEAEEASRAAIQLLERLPPGRERALAYRVQATLRLSNRDYAEAIQWGERAIELAERFDDQYMLAMAHIAVGSAYLFLDYAYGCNYLEKWLGIVRAAGQERQIANLLAYLGSCSVELYQLENAVRYLREGMRYTADRSLDIFHRYFQAWLALAEFRLGHWDEAEQISVQLRQRSNYPAISRIAALVATGLLRACRGRPRGNQALDEALVLAEGTGTLQYLGLVRSARAEAAWLAGQRQRTLLEARAAYDLAVSKAHPWLAGRFALWRWRAGDEFTPPAWIARPFALQMAGDWRAAAQAWEQIGCPYEQARAMEDGDLAAKTAALEIYERLDARPAAAALRQVLRSAGATKLPRKPRSKTRANPFGLTDRQVEILDQLVAECSNAEIAARLHISPKTVDHHVSAVLSRLSVHSRDEAAALASTNPHFQKR